MAQSWLRDGRHRTALTAAALLIIVLTTCVNAVGEYTAGACYAMEGKRVALPFILAGLPYILWKVFEQHPLLFVYGIGSNLPFLATILMARRWPAIVAAFAALALQLGAIVYLLKTGAIFSCSFGGGLDSAGIAILQLTLALPLGLVQLAFVALDRYWRLKKQAS